MAEQEHKVFRPGFYNWRSKYGGMDASQLKQVKEIQDENRRLKLNLRRKGKKRLPSRNPKPLLVLYHLLKSPILKIGRSFRK